MALTSPSKAELEEVWYKEVRIGDTINATVSDDFSTTSLRYCSIRFLNIIGGTWVGLREQFSCLINLFFGTRMANFRSDTKFLLP